MLVIPLVLVRLQAAVASGFTVGVIQVLNRSLRNVIEASIVMARDYRAEYDWQGDSIAFSHAGLSGVIRLDPGQVDVRIELGLLQRPFRRQIERGVSAALEKVLGGEPTS